MEVVKKELKQLMTEYLIDEYSNEEIEAMLNTAHVERIGDEVIAVYDNGVTETMVVKYMPFLITKPIDYNNKNAAGQRQPVINMQDPREQGQTEGQEQAPQPEVLPDAEEGNTEG